MSYMKLKTSPMQSFNHKENENRFDLHHRPNFPWNSVNSYPFRNLAEADERVPENPCINNPCGPNSQCRVIGNQGACSCLPNYIGRPPNCRPECVINSECPSNKACINERCIDPCVGKCGHNALCSVVKHNPVCNCLSGYEGDPFTRCTVIPVTCKTLILHFLLNIFSSSKN